MDNEMKRRVFLSGIVGLLVGTPIVVRLASGGKRGRSVEHFFSKELRKYRSLTATPMSEVTGASPFTLSLQPPIGREWRYVIFSPSYFPQGRSLATGDEPDVFLVRDGKLFVDETTKGQVVITGGDSIFQICMPTGTDQRPGKQVTLLVRDGRLFPARAKQNQPSAPYDLQLLSLLAMQQLPATELTLGMKWQSDAGRMKPFGGFTTRYEVAGFAEIMKRKTVRIAFSGKVPNMGGLLGVDPKAGPTVTVTNEHTGNAWFDLETGLLVRQELESVTNPVDSKDSEFAAKNRVTSKTVIQLFPT